MPYSGHGRPAYRRGQHGATIVVAVFIIVVLAFMGMIFLAMLSTSLLTAVNDFQAAAALSIAEGGVAFHQRMLAVNLDWYRSATDPLAVDTRALGAGSFTVTTRLPATKLRANLPSASTNPVRVYSTDRFPASGCLQIGDEFIRYTGLGTTAASCAGQPPCFTGITRAAAACFGGGVPEAHVRGDAVYPVTALVTALLNNCNPPGSITIAGHTKLLSAGTLDIEGEEISYASSSTSGVNLVLSGVQRCRNGTSSAAHSAGAPVTPVQSLYEADSLSIGTVGSASRAVRKTVHR